MKTIVIIPARAGSRRLPSKNMLDFCGRPLLAWTIIQAWACKHIDDVYVTTDSPKIAEIAHDYGAIVLMRENHMESLDQTGGAVPTIVAAQRIAKTQKFESVVNLFATSPLRRPGDLDRMVEKFYEVEQPVTFYTPHKDMFIARRLDSERYQDIIKDKTYSYMDCVGGSSIAPAQYFLDLPLDWNNQATWQDPLTFAEDPTPKYYVPVEWWQVFEIDFQEDFDLCQFFFERYLFQEWEGIYEQLSQRGRLSLRSE